MANIINITIFVCVCVTSHAEHVPVLHSSPGVHDVLHLLVHAEDHLGNHTHVQYHGVAHYGSHILYLNTHGRDSYTPSYIITIR